MSLLIKGRFKLSVDAMPHPYMKAEVNLLSRKAAVDFLVDTGADDTIIHPLDARRLRIPFPTGGEPNLKAYTGIGGSGLYVPHTAQLVFKNSLGPDYKWNNSIYVGPLNGERMATPSLLGRDFLTFHVLTLDYIRDLVTVAGHSEADAATAKNRIFSHHMLARKRRRQR